MKLIFMILLMLNTTLSANWLLDPNTLLCGVVGESTMNGDPFSINKSTCEKMSEYKINQSKQEYNPRKEFCTFDSTTGKFSTNYSEIPSAVIERYNNRVYTGWSGNVKYIEDKINIGIDIMRELKKCNIEASQYVNEYMKRKSVEGFDKVSFLYNGTDSVFNTTNEVLSFISSSLDLYDCNYDCEVHKEDEVGFNANELLDKMGNSTYSLNAIKNDTLYGICKKMKLGCLDVFIDNKDLSSKLREKLKLRGTQENPGLLDKISNKRDELIQKIRDQSLVNGTDRLNLADIQYKLNFGLNYPNRKINEYLKDELMGATHDSFSNLVSITNTCEAPPAKMTFNRPNLDLCNMDDLDSDFFKDRLQDLKKQLKLFKEQLVETMVSNMMNLVLNSLDNVKYVNELQSTIKRAQCLVQATVLQATDTEAIMAAQEKFASCRKVPEKTEVSADAQSGVRWFTKIIDGIPVIIPLVNPTAGAGVTTDPKAAIAASNEFSSCVMAGMGASYEKAYEKCLKGEEFSLTLDFMKTLKVDIIPELNKVKQLQCIMDKEEIKVDFFGLMADNIKKNFGLLRQERASKYQVGLQEQLVNNSSEDIIRSLAIRSKSVLNEDIMVALFIKENVRQCIGKKLEGLGVKSDLGEAVITKSSLDKIQNVCVNKKLEGFALNISSGMNVTIKRYSDFVVFDLKMTNSGVKSNFYKISYNRLEKLYERVKLELKLDQLDLENRLYRGIYLEDDRDIELFMGYYNSKDGITEKLFNGHLSELEKNISEIELSSYDSGERDMQRKKSIGLLIEKCQTKNLSERMSSQCQHFMEHQSELKSYGGFINGN